MNKNTEDLRETGIACRGTITHVEWVRKSFSTQKSDRAKYRVLIEAPGREPFEVEEVFRHPTWSEGLQVGADVPAFSHPTRDEVFLDFGAVDTMATAVDRALPKDDAVAEIAPVAETVVVETHAAALPPAYENRLIGLPESDQVPGHEPVPVAFDEPVPVSIAPSAATPVAILAEPAPIVAPEQAFATTFAVASSSPYVPPTEAPLALPVNEVVMESAPSFPPDGDEPAAVDPFAPLEPISQAPFAPITLGQPPVAPIVQTSAPAPIAAAAPTPFGSVFGEVSAPVQIAPVEQALPVEPEPFVEVTAEQVSVERPFEAPAPFSQPAFVLSQVLRPEESDAPEVEPQPVAEVVVEPVAAFAEVAWQTGLPAATEPVAEIAVEQPAPVFEPAPVVAFVPPAPPAPVAQYPAPPAPPVWHRDPTGRHELRYWDGVSWTEHVTTAGVQSTDQL